MIIETEEDSKQPRLDVPRITAATAEGPSTSALTAPAQPDVPPPYTPRDTDPLLPGRPARRKKRKFWKRCWRSFWRHAPLLLVGAIAGVLLYVTFGTAGWRSSDRVRVECDSTKSKSWSWVEVTEGLDTAFYADTIVVVPRHATELTIESSSYRNFNGTVNVRAPVAYPGDQIRIDIRAFHRDRRYLEKIGVCRPSQSIRPGPAALLFRVDVRDSEQWAEPVELDVTVLLPNDFRRAGHPKLLRDFSARLDFIDFRIANLSRAVFLENFVLSSRSGNILIEGVDARQVTLSTGRGRIEGSVSSASAVNVTNSDGPVDLNVTVLRSEYDETFNRSNSVSISALGSINSSIAFETAWVNTSRLSVGLPLQVVAHTLAHPIDLSLTSAPLDPTIRVDAFSDTGDVSVQMPLEFEGDVSLQGGRNVTLRALRGPDPSGQERERIVTCYPTGVDGCEGSVTWLGHVPHDMGSVRVYTQSAALLSL